MTTLIQNRSGLQTANIEYRLQTQLR